jgi:hypothetical protein
MTIDETFARIYHETHRDAVKCVRIGLVQSVEIITTCDFEDMREVSEGRFNGLRFYVDKGFDGIEVEYLEDRSGAHEAVKRLCVDLHIPCRAI